MTNTQRFIKLMNFEPDIDRTPIREWAGWWDQTLNNWWAQGLPRDRDINEFFGQDRLIQFCLPIRDEGCPQPSHFGAPIMTDEKEYEAIRPYLYTDRLLQWIRDTLTQFAQTHSYEDWPCWFSLDGFFWFPRTLFGIENHLLAFYDYPDLMTRINQDLCEYYKKVLEIVFDCIRPVFMSFAEDMSYNLGPMLSKEHYDQFLLPYYKQLVPIIQSYGTKVFIDTDGNVEPLIPWFLEGGIEGIFPLERMAGVDVNRIRQKYPRLLMMGGFDKTVMHLGEEAMRTEFERILPVIRSGGYFPSVDHQTPPDVSLENYWIFMKLLREYSYKIAE